MFSVLQCEDCISTSDTSPLESLSTYGSSEFMNVETNPISLVFLMSHTLMQDFELKNGSSKRHDPHFIERCPLVFTPRYILGFTAYFPHCTQSRSTVAHVFCCLISHEDTDRASHLNFIYLLPIRAGVLKHFGARDPLKERKLLKDPLR